MHKSVRTAAALGTVLIAAAGAWQGYRVYRHEREALERARLWADFSTCVIGEPLGPGETLEQRFHGIELALERDTSKLPVSTEWPLSCAPARDALVNSHAMARAPDLRDAVLVGFRELEKKRTPRSLSNAFELGKKLPPVPVRADAVRPPPPITPRVASSALAKGALLRAPVAFEHEPHGLHLLSLDGRLCDDVSASFRCRVLGGSVKDARLGFAATTRREPFRVSAHRGKELALLGPDGAELGKLADEPNEVGEPAVHVAASGVVTALHSLDPSPRYGLEEGSRLVRYRDKGDPLRLDLPPAERELRFVGDFLLGRSGDQVSARPIDPGDALLGKPTPLGTFKGRVLPLSCPDGSFTALVEGEDELMRWREGYVALSVYQTPAWKLVSRVELRKRAGPPGLACAGDAATLVWVESNLAEHHVRRLRCRAPGCSEDGADVHDVKPLGFFRSKDGVDVAVRAAPLGDAVVLAWWSRDEAVRMSVGALPELGRGEVLFDASPYGLAAFGGDKNWLGDLALEPAGDTVLVALTLGSKDVVLLRVGRDGNAIPALPLAPG